MFKRRNDEEFIKLQTEVDRSITEILKLQHDMELTKTNLASLRGLVNRKLQQVVDEDIEIYKNPNGLDTLNGRNNLFGGN